MSDVGPRRRVGPAEGGRLYFELLGVLFRHDPIGINFEENVNEYSSEAETILPRLGEAEDVEALASLIHEEFDLWFSGVAGPRERYLPMARDLWPLLNDPAPVSPQYEEVLEAWLDLLRESWPPMEAELIDDQMWVSQAVTAYLAGFRPLPAWAVEVLERFESHAAAARLPTAPQRNFLERLVALGRRIRTAH